MSHEVAIHKIQTIILRELLFKPEASFSELRKLTDVESDHFKFHVARLIDIGYIAKNKDGKYLLSTKGKEYANKLDTDEGIVERQPKSAVILVIEQHCTDKTEYLVQERLKHPYFGFWGFPGGKIRWGETIAQAAARELKEETGLIGNFVHKGVYHEHAVNTESKAVLEDKIFHVMFCNDASGELIKEFEGGRNQWTTLEEVRTKKYRYSSFDVEADIGINGIPFTEMVQYYSDEQF